MLGWRAKGPPAMPKARKVQVYLDDETLAALSVVQRASGATSIAEVLRSATGLLHWAYQQVEQGYTVGTFKDGFPAKEVVLASAPR